MALLLSGAVPTVFGFEGFDASRPRWHRFVFVASNQRLSPSRRTIDATNLDLLRLAMMILVLPFLSFGLPAASAIVIAGSADVLDRPLAAVAAVVPPPPDSYCHHRRAKRIAKPNPTLVWSVLSRTVHLVEAKTQISLENVSCYCGSCCRLMAMVQSKVP